MRRTRARVRRARIVRTAETLHDLERPLVGRTREHRIAGGEQRVAEQVRDPRDILVFGTEPRGLDLERTAHGAGS